MRSYTMQDLTPMPPKRLDAVFYTKVMRWNSRRGLTRRLDRLLGRHSESVIQDVDIPIPHAPQLLVFLLREIGILPIWLCPIRPQGRRFTCHIPADCMVCDETVPG